MPGTIPRFGDPVNDEHVLRSLITNDPRNLTRLRRSGVVCKDMGGCKNVDDVPVVGPGVEYGGVALQCHTYSRDYNFFSQITMCASLELAIKGEEAPELKELDDEEDL